MKPGKQDPKILLLQKLISAELGSNATGLYASPMEYWQNRYAIYGSSLAGVGCVKLTHGQNAADYDTKWHHIEAVLNKRGPTIGKSLLDAGCGAGWFTAKFLALGFDVSAVDFSSNAIRLARKNLPDGVQWHISPLEKFAAKRQYDVVACIDVLFHIIDDALFTKTVTNLINLTTPGGALVIQEHLIPESEVVEPPLSTHANTRFRSIHHYLNIMEKGWTLRDHVIYKLPQHEQLKESGIGSHKDLLVFAREGD